MFKMIYFYTFLLIFSLLLSGCSYSNKDYMTPNKANTQKSNEIMEALQNNDTEAFKENLCPYIQDTHSELDKEVCDFYDFINGDILSFDTPKSPATSGSSTELDGWVEKSITGRIENIKTSSGMTYRIDYTYYYINKEHSEKLGITYIDIVVNDAEYDNTTGYPPDEFYAIELE